MEMSNYPEWGKEISNIAISCSNCGTAKDKRVAFFLCLFLGIFETHKFYEGLGETPDLIFMPSQLSY